MILILFMVSVLVPPVTWIYKQPSTKPHLDGRHKYKGVHPDAPNG